ncbi:glycosyltransferase [Candidatus Roizmanbacteria bacterium]|nr:glycosyltransferase [Candidatus Roizmanbacteria bacterium]
MNKLIYISPFPPSHSYSHKNSALASFSFHLLSNIQHKKITVLADAGEHPEVSDQFSPDITLDRCWKRNHPFVFIQLLLRIRTEKSSQVLVQYEWNVFGSGLWYLIQFPVFLWALKCMKKRVTVVLHGVLLNFAPLSPTFIGLYLLNGMAQLFYKAVSYQSDRVIVLEEKLKSDLVRIGIPSKKVGWIPHGVDTELRSIEKQYARELLNIPRDCFLFVYFGFIADYKAPDILLNQFRTLIDQEEIYLYFVGGKRFHKKHDLYYERFMNQLATCTDRIHFTGYVSKEQIELYLSACDVMVFPHRTLLSSSGPLSLAYTFEKPILLSNQLKGYLESPDFQKALLHTKLNEEYLFYDFTKNHLKEKIYEVYQNMQKLQDFSLAMKQARAWPRVAKMYEKTLRPGE